MRCLFVAILALSACTEVVGPEAATLNSGEVELQPETVLLDTLSGIDEVIVEFDRVILWTRGELPEIEVGSVLVGERGGGVLRTVTGIQVDGTRTILETRHARLTDAVAAGHVQTRVNLFPERSATVFDFGGRVLYDNWVWSESEGDYVYVSVTTNETAHVTFEPIIDYDIDVGLTSVEAGFDALFTLDVDAAFIASVDGSFDEALDLEIAHREVPFRFEMGEVPIWGTAHIDVRAIIDADFEAGAQASLSTEAHAWAMASAHFYDAWGPDNRRWDTAFDAGVDGDDNGEYLSFDNGYDGRGNAKVRVVADVSLDLYDAAGARVRIEPWADLEVCEGGLDVSAGAGVAGMHQYYFEALGWSIIDSDEMPFDFGPWTIRECPAW